MASSSIKQDYIFKDHDLAVAVYLILSRFDHNKMVELHDNIVTVYYRLETKEYKDET